MTFDLRAAAFAAALATGLAFPIAASDHKDAPYTNAHPAADIGDIFVFQGPETGGLAMVFTVNPLSGSGMEGTNPPDEIALDPQYIYQFKLDTTGDDRADLAYKIRVEAGEGQSQPVTIRMATGADAEGNDWVGDEVGTGMTTALNAPMQVVRGKAGELLFVGPRRDPFFFDFMGVEAPAALAIRQALAGGDNLPAAPTSLGAFGRTDMTLIVLEVPSLGRDPVGFWVVVADSDGNAVDRMGRTAVQGIYFVNPATGYNPEAYLPVDRAKYPDVGALNDAYNSTAPVDDRANYGAELRKSFERLEVRDEEMDEMIDFFLPDILRFDPAQPMYPNQRNLREDAVYWTIEKVNPFMYPDEKDRVRKESTQRLSPRFPYVAPSIAQEYKPGAAIEPVHPIYLED
ncbi:MAG: DUF4331 family protein [Paracoccaceae bacterium]|jgi:hypothetical protein|nr:DUF4331 family protein [Paracoccaceae bacterium]